MNVAMEITIKSSRNCFVVWIREITKKTLLLLYNYWKNLLLVV